MSDSEQVQIVLTGAGLVTCLGLGVEPTWNAVGAGRCGIGASTALQSSPNPDKGYGQAPPLPDDYLPDLPREARFLRHAIDEAVAQARLVDDDGAWSVAPDRCGLVLGTTLHGMRAAGPFFRQKSLAALGNFLAGSTARLALGDLPIHGQSVTTCAACASGLMSIGLGMSLLARGELDLIIAGGYDPVSEYAYGGFNSLRLVSESMQRPFAKQRDGLKLAEGYAVVVLERAADARSRGSRTIGRVRACTATSDAHHLSQPHPEGLGAARAMRDALDQAKLGGNEIAMITAHATATPDNDRAEALALNKVFGDGLAAIPVAAMKSGLGHTLGAAGTVELILTLCALRDGMVPPLANVDAADIEFDGLRVVTGNAQTITGKHALITSLGFGGSNACAIISSPGPDTTSPARTAPRPTPILPDDRQPVITGLGVIYPNAIGIDPLLALLRDGGTASREPDAAEVTALLNTRRTRRMSNFVKNTLAATALACRDAGLDDASAYPGVLGAILGTMHGSARFSEDYYLQLVSEGVDGVNPLLFAEGVPNAGTAHLSMMLGLTGPSQTLIGSRTSGLDAVRVAASHIASGAWDAALVGGAEEYTEMVEQCYTHCGLHAKERDAGVRPFESEDGFVCSAGAATLLIESRMSARKRGARIYGTLTAWDQCAWGDGTHRPPIKPAILRVAAMLARPGKTTHLLSSANGTWIDPVEAMAIRVASAETEQAPAVGCVAPKLHETFSAAPLLGLAAALRSGQWLDAFVSPTGTAGAPPVAPETEPLKRLAVLASDYNGLSTAIWADLEP